MYSIYTSLFLYLIQFDVNIFCNRLHVLCTWYTEENIVFFYYWNIHAHYKKPRLLAVASRKESNLFLTFTAWNKVIIEKQNSAKFFLPF